MKPEQYDSPTRWILQSSKPNQVHLVDVSSFNFNGECSCEDFSCVKIKAIERGEKRGSKTQCKHILYVREYLADIFIQALNATKEISNPENK